MTTTPPKNRKADTAEPRSAAREQVDELRSRLRSGLGEMVQRAGEGAGRLRKAAEGMRRSPIVQNAVAARERGNWEAAFWLLDEVFGADPDDLDAAVLFWDVAVELDRPKAAVGAALALIHRHAAAQEAELAVQYWQEVSPLVSEAVVAPSAVARMWPELEKRIAVADDETRPAAVELARRALAGALTEGRDALTPGLALRLAEAGRELDPDVAREIAQIALASTELHDAKRARLEEWADPDAAASRRTRQESAPTGDPSATEALDFGASEAPLDVDKPEDDADTPGEPIEGPAALHPLHEASRQTTALSEAEIAAAAARLPPVRDTDTVVRLEVSELDPVALAADELLGVLQSGDELCVPYAEVHSMWVVRVGGLGDEVVSVIDLVLDSGRVVRMRGDRFEAKNLVGGEADPDEAMRSLLGELLERTHAVPLPDPDAALGLCDAYYDSLEEYEDAAYRGDA